MEQKLIQKFEERIFYAPDGCWYWLGACRSGYGHLKHKGRTVSATRMSYELYKGLINANCVLHTCDNPLCVNPDHLFLGTYKDNMQDMVRKNRHRYANKTHCKHGHLIADNFYINERGYKICKTCLNENWKRNYYKRKEKAKSICNKN